MKDPFREVNRMFSSERIWRLFLRLREGGMEIARDCSEWRVRRIPPHPTAFNLNHNAHPGWGWEEGEWSCGVRLWQRRSTLQQGCSSGMGGAFRRDCSWGVPDCFFLLL